MKEISYLQAIREALAEEMKRDSSVFLFGEDIGVYGGAFGVTKGLIEEFGEKRVIDSPMSEAAIVGVATGAAIGGLRPVVEIMFMDFITLAMDQIVNHAAKVRYMYNGQFHAPIVVRTPAGAGRGYGCSHSQSFESWFMHVPGLKVIAPSTPADVKGLLKSAIRDNNPVIFIENKLLYKIKGQVPEEDYIIPLGLADVKQEGKDVTIATYSRMVSLALEASKELQKDGIDVEVIDLRTLLPLDIETIISSIKKTKKLLVLGEDCKTAGVGAEISAQVAEKGFHYLEKPIKRIACEDSPIPCSPIMEDHILPDKAKIIKEVKEMVKKE
jgi:pyruvate/2-oxoglutarate/acetoin dehydrogenase E1 component